MPIAAPLAAASHARTDVGLLDTPSVDVKLREDSSVAIVS